MAELTELAAEVGRSSGTAAPLVRGTAANVARCQQVAAFADFAKAELGTVDMWIK